MADSNFMFYFNQALNEKERIFKLSKVILNNDDSINVTFILKYDDYDKLLTEELREKVVEVTRDLVPSDYKVNVKFKKTVTDVGHVTNLIMDFIYTEAPLIFPKINDLHTVLDIGYDEVLITLKLQPYILSFMSLNGFKEKLEEFLNTELMENVTVNFIPATEDESVTSFKRKKMSGARSAGGIKVIDVKTNQPLYGSIAKKPRYISDVIKSESESVTVCGKVVNFNRLESKKTGKAFYTFKLDDSTGLLDCKFFPRDSKTATRVENHVCNDTQLIVEGPLRADSYIRANALTVYRLALCDIDYSTIKNEVVYNEVNEEYISTFPEPFVEEEQGSMFEVKRALPDALKGEVVVFDLETTGLNAVQDKIIEIGAVKMRDGIIVESFGTLVNPNCAIPPAATAVNHITDADVEKAPPVAEALADFYKFTRGATLVAQNATFDMGFISYHGKALLWNFDNEVMDTMEMSRALLSIKGHSLAALCKYFNIINVEAHRAVSDALVTAKVFKELCYLK